MKHIAVSFVASLHVAVGPGTHQSERRRASIAAPRITSWRCRPIAIATPVQSFTHLHQRFGRLADWLIACGSPSVAMEATGVYWIPVYEILEAPGFEVLLVNARHVKNVPGRKSDVSDCEWLRDLHIVGLATRQFPPTRRHRGAARLSPPSADADGERQRRTSCACRRRSCR